MGPPFTGFVGLAHPIDDQSDWDLGNLEAKATCQSNIHMNDSQPACLLPIVHPSAQLNNAYKPSHPPDLKQNVVLSDQVTFFHCSKDQFWHSHTHCRHVQWWTGTIMGTRTSLQLRSPICSKQQRLDSIQFFTRLSILEMLEPRHLAITIGPRRSHSHLFPLAHFPASNTWNSRTDGSLAASYILPLDRCHCKDIMVTLYNTCAQICIK